MVSKIMKFVVLVFLLTSAIAVHAQETSTQLTDSQMAQATEVSSFENLPSLQYDVRGESALQARGTDLEQIYKLADCDVNSEDQICFLKVTFTVSVDENPTKIDPQGLSRAASPLVITQTCGYSLYSVAGIESARLQQRINTSYWTGNTIPPLTLNWGNLSGTFATIPWSWQNTSGPTANVGWGQNTWGSVYITASGDLQSIWGGFATYGTIMTINGSGTSCS